MDILRLLTNYNRSYNINEIPDKVEDIRYGVLDYSNHQDPDFMFLPLIYLESFSSPCIDIKIGPYGLQMPLDWSVIIGDINLGDLEVMPVLQLMDKDFDVFCFNPINGFMPKFHKLEVINTWPDVKWYFPKLKHGHLLAVPLDGGSDPLCAFFVKELNKLPDVIDIRELI